MKLGRGVWQTRKQVKVAQDSTINRYIYNKLFIPEQA